MPKLIKNRTIADQKIKQIIQDEQDRLKKMEQSQKVKEIKKKLEDEELKLAKLNPKLPLTIVKTDKKEETIETMELKKTVPIIAEQLNEFLKNNQTAGIYKHKPGWITAASADIESISIDKNKSSKSIGSIGK